MKNSSSSKSKKKESVIINFLGVDLKGKAEIFRVNNGTIYLKGKGTLKKLKEEK